MCPFSQYNYTDIIMLLTIITISILNATTAVSEVLHFFVGLSLANAYIYNYENVVTTHRPKLHYYAEDAI